jgi:flagellar hook-length control protein FliK
VQALAQSQADAEAGAHSNATAAAEETGGPGGGKAKTASTDTASASPSLAFISQSLAAAMVGVQMPAVGQGAAASSPVADNGSTDSIPIGGGGLGGSAEQGVIASLSKGAEDLRASAEDASGLKSDAPATLTHAADASSPAPTAFQAQMTSLAQHAASTEAPVTKVDAPVGTAAFNDELGGKITWMASQGIQSASLQLSPEHLGPVAVRISVHDGSAAVSFNAMHADTRAALEQALPRLREMFATHGLTLTDASVSQQSPRGQAQKQSVAAIGPGSRLNDDTNAAPVASVASARLGLVDTYA